VDDVIFSHTVGPYHGTGDASRVKLNVMNERQHRFHITAYIRNDSPGYGRSLTSTMALFYTHHIFCQCAVQKLELSLAVNRFVKHAMNGVTKEIFNIGKFAKSQ